jgi:hypothetical protein
MDFWTIIKIVLPVIGFIIGWNAGARKRRPGEREKLQSVIDLLAENNRQAAATLEELKKEKAEIEKIKKGKKS